MYHKQHFLLSAQARTLSVRQVFELTDSQAFEMFKQVRWGLGDEVTCPRCGVIRNHYFVRVRRQWRCKDCTHSFSVTSGTIFAHHKLPLRIYLAAIALFTNSVKGISSLQLSRDLGVQYKTAFILSHKIRESLMEQREAVQLSGEVHVDGAYVNGSIRPANKKSDRVDRRLAVNQKDSKRCVLVFRQKAIAEAVHGAVGGNAPVVGASKTITFIVKSENQADVKVLAERVVQNGSTIHADESAAYDILHAKYNTKRVNHQIEYQTEDGINTNMAESYFARFRRMQYGQTHKFGNEYLANYANEAAYREDTRRWSNGAIFMDILSKCLKTQTHHDWCGYWQGNKRGSERLAA